MFRKPILVVVVIFIFVIFVLLYIYYKYNTSATHIIEGATAPSCTTPTDTISSISITTAPPPTPPSSNITVTDLTTLWNSSGGMGFMPTAAQLATINEKAKTVYNLMSRINALLPQTTQDIIATPASVNVVSFDNKDQVKFFIQNVPYNVPSDLSDAVDVFHQYGYAQWVITAQLPMLPPGIQGVAGSMGLVGPPGQNGKPGPPGARGPWGGTIIQ